MNMNIFCVPGMSWNKYAVNEDVQETEATPIIKETEATPITKATEAMPLTTALMSEEKQVVGSQVNMSLSLNPHMLCLFLSTYYYTLPGHVANQSLK